MKTAAILLFMCCSPGLFAQSKKPECQKIRKQEIKRFKTVEELVKTTNGCKVKSATTTARVKGKVMSNQSGNKLTEDTYNILEGSDNNAFVYIDVIFDCGGKNQTKKFCFQVMD